MRTLLSYYRSLRLVRALEHIERHATPGDVLCGGHIDFRSVFGRLTKDVKIVTMIRNPYDRSRSEYFYARQNFLRKSRVGRLDTSLIPQVAASRDFESYIDFLWEYRQIYGDISAQYIGIAPSTDIAEFFRRHVFHAGVLERAAHFVRILQEKLGVRFGFPCLNVRGSADHVTLSTAAKRRIDLIYARDFEIYEYLLGQTHELSHNAGTGPESAHDLRRVL